MAVMVALVLFIILLHTAVDTARRHRSGLACCIVLLDSEARFMLRSDFFVDVAASELGHFPAQGIFGPF